ncbi:hypothetical protein B0H17DRAFT_854555, partial [Mycena rosella]
LKPYVDAEIMERFMNFPYMKTQADLDEFTAWVTTLKIRKVQDWWKHKLQYPWILSAIIKSRSHILPGDWDLTDSNTNLNEGQHHWTNQQTGVKLTLLESIERARIVDFKTARELKDSEETGVLDNNSNNLLHRMGRNVQRESSSVTKARLLRTQDDTTAQLQLEYDAAKAAMK